jgi:predicted RecB family nuclease
MTEPRRCELELNNIETVEALAAAEETTLRNIGEPYVELAKIAKLQVTADKQKADLVEEVIVTTKTLKAVKEKSDEPVDNRPDGS